MRWVFFSLILMTLAAFSQLSVDSTSRNKTISTGEQLDYRMYLGFFTVGKGVTTVDNKYYVKNEHPCYKVDAYMQTLGMATWISKVNDNWGAYIDTARLITHESYRKIQEGNYRLNEIITYDHDLSQASVNVADKQTGKFGKPKTYPIPREVRDIVAGFMYLRVINFTKLNVGDTLAVSGFFEDKSYNFKIIYFGKETIEMDFGNVPCYKLIPIMPDNQLFRGKNSITAWISADGNQVPVKVDAKMFIGHAGTELTSFRGLKNQFKIVSK
ncbi:MAG: hypothetical protein OJF59_003185 [Cytophagales bacterium]|jgi:hypothetical protein|nr:DUF3108 domain-containing protein [Bacteroidota bacterium]MBS1981977.1 DUF3108 domain-containing protein [Bacteroidota bacterium]WHZ09429.1 MAG: hypothetical protein OJF59_003185 [Cytophagales bacterium]